MVAAQVRQNLASQERESQVVAEVEVAAPLQQTQPVSALPGAAVAPERILPAKMQPGEIQQGQESPQTAPGEVLPQEEEKFSQAELHLFRPVNHLRSGSCRLSQHILKYRIPYSAPARFPSPL